MRGPAVHLKLSQRGLHSRAWARTALETFVVPLKGYVRREALLSAEALPFRPNTGTYLIVSQVVRHHDAESDSVFHWYDQTRIPDLLTCPGAVGAWTFGARDFYAPDRDLARPTLRITLVYLEGDPLAFATAIAGLPKSRTRDTSPVEETLFAGPLRAILPWQWDWFDDAAERGAQSAARR